MLKQRIITALVLLAVLLPALFYPAPEAFGLVAIFFIAAGAWEWGRLNQLSQGISLTMGGTCALMCIASWYSSLVYASLRPLWVLAGSAWVLLGALLLSGGASAWSRVPGVLKVLGGLIALWVTWLAVAQARSKGINFLFSVLVLVWIADVFAYFAGRSLGGKFIQRKLAPSISPGKTWEGVIGGMLGVVLCAFVWRQNEVMWAPDHPSLYRTLGENGSFFMVLAVLFLSSMSVVGDLAESLFKRSAGVKDSSALLPGHGGVLDRVDALLPTLPLAMMLATL
jgi:phosphatidate cytidylyltransferase